MLKVDFHIILLVFFVVEIINKYCPFLRLSIILKSIFFVYLIVLNFTYIRKEVSYLFILFLISQSYIYSFLDYEKDFFLENIRWFVLYMFPLLLCLKIDGFFKEDKRKRFLSFLVYEIIISIVIFSTFIGFFFKTPYFETYLGDRFGYMGVLNKSATASFFYIAAIIFTYHHNKVLFVFSVIASLLVGTKSIMLFLILLLFYHIFSYKKNNRVILLIITLFMFFYKKILIITKPFWSLHYDFYKKEGLITSLSSFRNNIFKKLSKEYIEYWDTFNYFFGGKVFVGKLFEMSIFDLVSFFGLIGSVFYLYTYVKYMSFSSKSYKKYYIFSICSILMISCFSGQFFLNSSIVIYLVFVFYSLNEKFS